jgi:GntR family transcriptional regulator, carbon starvation induced regulator
MLRKLVRLGATEVMSITQLKNIAQVNSTRTPSPPLKVGDDQEQEALLVDVAWRRLLEDIVSGRLAPNTRLRVSKLREIYGIGASPLREALSRLAADGFARSLERRGFVVAPVSLAEFRDLTNVRKLLEREALNLSLQNGDDKWESQVTAAFYRLTKAQERFDPNDPETLKLWEEVNREFHETLVSACTSPWVLQLRRTVYNFAERYRRICQTVTTISRDVQREHKQMKDAALERDSAKLNALLDEHLERTYLKVAASGKL